MFYPVMTYSRLSLAKICCLVLAVGLECSPLVAETRADLVGNSYRQYRYICVCVSVTKEISLTEMFHLFPIPIILNRTRIPLI